MVRLELYLAGQSRNSMIAHRNLKAALTSREGAPIELTVIDILEQPLRALKEGVLVTPTVVRREPQPLRIVVGTLDCPADLSALLDVAGGAAG
jgi:circadian clock protein KaiB